MLQQPDLNQAVPQQVAPQQPASNSMSQEGVAQDVRPSYRLIAIELLQPSAYTSQLKLHEAVPVLSEGRPSSGIDDSG